MCLDGSILSSQQNNLNLHNKSKIDLPMFNLCKTVKIYQTVNHYHNDQHTPHVDSHQLNYSENCIPSSQDIALKTNESHNFSHSKTRTGISVSIKKPSRLSPGKKYHNQRYNSDLLGVSHQLNQLYQSKSKQTQFNSIKLKTTNRYDNESPLFVESKITYGEMSPKLQICQPLQTRFCLPQSELPLLAEIPLKRELTRTTQQSMRKSEPKIEININPLKKSAVFLRNSNNKHQQSQTIKNSMVQSSVKNSIDFKLSTSKIKSKDISESLLKLSSSFSQIMDEPYNQLPFDQLSRTCSLELKKDQNSALLRKDESGFLKEYVCEVNESIIVQKQNNSKQLKIVKSNNDLLHKHCPQDFKASLSNIIEREDSPVKRLKKRYGENLLNPYDKETIVSKSFASKSNYQQQKRQIIDQSIIIQHQIQANKFIPLKEKALNRQFFSIYLAIENTTHLLVSIKELPINRIDKINNQLTLYRQIQSIEVGISKLYQTYTHGTSYILIKQPFQYTLQEFIEKKSQEYVLISWQFITRSIEDMIKKTIMAMQKKKIYLTKLISTDDLVYVFGQWKLHSPEMFCQPGTQKTSIQLEQALQLLKQQILGRIRERKILN